MTTFVNDPKDANLKKGVNVGPLAKPNGLARARKC